LNKEKAAFEGGLFFVWCYPEASVRHGKVRHGKVMPTSLPD